MDITRGWLSQAVHFARVRLLRRFLVKLKRASHRVQPAALNLLPCRVLVVAPHMDDEAIACGGTLLRLAALKSAIHVVFVSDSSAGLSDPTVAAALTAQRKLEAHRSISTLGTASMAMLDYPDANLGLHEAEITNRLSSEIEAFRPDTVLVPFPADSHADHMVCAVATAEALQSLGWVGTVLAYEVWAPLWATAFVDISEVAQQKRELIELYESQQADRDYASAMLGLNRYRGLRHKIEFAEAFHVSSSNEFAKLVANLNTI